MSAWRWAGWIAGAWLAVSVVAAIGWARMALPAPGGEGEGEGMGGTSDAAGGGVSRIPYGGGGQ
jgi:hypothetical protein